MSASQTLVDKLLRHNGVTFIDFGCKFIVSPKLKRHVKKGRKGKNRRIW